MQNHKTKIFSDFKSMVRSLLGLDPLALMLMDSEQCSVAAGLHQFVMATLERALEASSERAGPTIRLVPDTATRLLRELGWADAQTYNASSLWVHALIEAPRRARGLAQITLCPGLDNVSDFPWRIDARTPRPVDEVVSAAFDTFNVDVREPGEGSSSPLSICTLIRELFGLAPITLIQPCYEDETAAAAAFARDPDAVALNGLAVLMMTALDVCHIGCANDVGTICLQLTDDAHYAGTASAFYSNLVQLLIAAVFADRSHHVKFCLPG